MAKKNGDGSDKDQGMAIAAMVALVVLLLGPIVLLVFWDKMGVAVTAIASHVRYAEMLLFAGFSDTAQRLLQMVGVVTQSTERMTFENFSLMMERTGYYTRWIFIPPIVAMGVIAFMRSPRERYTTVHSMSSLAKQEAKIWPEIAPVAGLQDRLVKEDPTKGEWASAMTEREFAHKHNLITSDADGKPAAKRDETREIFAEMLGRRWTSPYALPDHMRALFAAFAMRIGGDAEGCTAKLRLLATTFAAGGAKGIDCSWVNAEIKKHIGHPLVQRAIEKHAYEYTVMATMLQLAKTDGVLASPMFIWVKTVDRKLWYTLNNVGRYAFHVDCAGIMAHWLFEKTVRMAIPTPMVSKAVDGLDMALKEYRDDDSVERMFD